LISFYKNNNIRINNATLSALLILTNSYINKRHPNSNPYLIHQLTFQSWASAGKAIDGVYCLQWKAGSLSSLVVCELNVKPWLSNLPRQNEDSVQENYLSDQSLLSQLHWSAGICPL